VELKEYFVEGLVHVTTLTDDYYTFLEKEHTLVGETSKKSFRPGKEVRVKITGVDLERRRIEMALQEEEKKKPARARPAKKA
jgi:ribonuclease R